MLREDKRLFLPLSMLFLWFGYCNNRRDLRAKEGEGITIRRGLLFIRIRKLPDLESVADFHSLLL